MSDVMFYGVLRMPYEMAMASEISRLQFYNRAQEAVDRVERVEAELAAARALLREVLNEDGASLDTEARIRSYLDASDKQGGGHV